MSYLETEESRIKPVFFIGIGNIFTDFDSTTGYALMQWPTTRNMEVLRELAMIFRIRSYIAVERVQADSASLGQRLRVVAPNEGDILEGAITDGEVSIFWNPGDHETHSVGVSSPLNRLRSNLIGRSMVATGMHISPEVAMGAAEHTLKEFGQIVIRA